MKQFLVFAIAVLVLLVACRKDVDPEPVDTPDASTAVSFDMALVPYDSLSTYHFFEGAPADLEPVAGVLPFEPINSLFSDYAHKSRFVWMPTGAGATYESDSSVLVFPEGAVMIKNFYYEHAQPGDTRRIMETRLIFRRNGAWEFATYAWNQEQTEAYLDTDGEYIPISFLDDSGSPQTVNYRIPTNTECLTCHRKGPVSTPIGPKPQNLNSPFNYTEGTMNQLEKWTAAGYLQGGYPGDINTVADWKDASRSLTDRVRGYVDANCSHCHTDGRYCDYRPMRFSWTESVDPAMLGVCVAPHDPLLPIHSHLVKPGNTEKSLVYYRINSAQDGIRMPLLGRTLVHEEGRQLIEDWINSLTQTCN